MNRNLSRLWDTVPSDICRVGDFFPFFTAEFPILGPVALHTIEKWRGTPKNTYTSLAQNIKQSHSGVYRNKTLHNRVEIRYL